MKAGARDFLTEPVDATELITTLTRLARERAGTRGTTESRLTAVMNAKGGSGATLLACNLAHIMASRLALRVGLIDMDLQFGTLPLYLDLERSQGLINALAESHDLDAISLDAMAAKHASGVRVFGAMSDEVLLPSELDTLQLDRVMRVAQSLYDHVVVDLPRQIDPVTTAVLERANIVLLVIQESVAHLRDAKRLVSILVRELQVAPQDIQILVNRHQPRSMVTRADIERALGDHAVHVIPNDFKLVGECVNLGLPLAERNRKAALTRSLDALAESISGRPPPKRRWLFGWRRANDRALQAN
jgi:pilus assembly protein CpaE